MDFTPLSLITIATKDVRIRVRIARSWDFINPRNLSQIFSYELLLIDNQGATIQATISNDVADRLRPILLEGSVFHISGFSVLAAQQNYRISTHPCRIRLPYNSYIKEITDDTLDIPYDSFNFLTFDDVKARVGMTDYVIDTYGLVTRLGDMERVRALDLMKYKRSVFIENSSGEEIEVTFWDNMALTFPEEYIVSCAENKPVSIAFVAVIARPFNDGFTLNSTAGTKVFVNPEIPEIVSFIEEVNKPYPLLHKTAPLLDDGTDIEDERGANRKTIAELRQIDIHTNKEIKYTCSATIKQIDPEDGWWYRACPRCKSSVQNIDDKLWCKNCRFIDALPVTWYRVRLIVEDTTGNIPFVLFGRMAADLIGVPAHTLAASFKERHQIPPMLTKFYGTKKTFQIQLSNQIEDPSKISFKVMYIFKDTLVTPKKEIPSPVSTRSTLLTVPQPKCIKPPTAQKTLQFETFELPTKPSTSVDTPAKKRRKEPVTPGTKK